MAKKARPASNLKTIIVSIFMVAIVLFYFSYLSNRSAKRRTENKKSELESLMEYDMNAEYPKTARDLAKLHCRYMKMIYTEKLSDEELDKLNRKMRMLYCSELLALNPESGSLDRMKKDIANTKEQKLEYKVYELPEASQVKKYVKDGKEMAQLEVRITMDTEEGKGYLYEEYVMIKEGDNWKIYGWMPAEGNQTTTEE